MADGKQINVRDIPPDLLKTAKKKAIDEGKSLNKILLELLEKWAKEKPPPTHK